MKKANITIEIATRIRIRECFDFLKIHESDLTDSQIDLVNSMKRQYFKRKELSEKQQQVLFSIAKYLEEPNKELIVRSNY